MKQTTAIAQLFKKAFLGHQFQAWSHLIPCFLLSTVFCRDQKAVGLNGFKWSSPIQLFFLNNEKQRFKSLFSALHSHKLQQNLRKFMALLQYLNIASRPAYWTQFVTSFNSSASSCPSLAEILMSSETPQWFQAIKFVPGRGSKSHGDFF